MTLYVSQFGSSQPFLDYLPEYRRYVLVGYY